ncbi:glycosyl transferase family 2 [Calothrix sp. 336/3]|nr:glycosyl transferase family 2 [Calothrix sp. 336/3]
MIETEKHQQLQSRQTELRKRQIHLLENQQKLDISYSHLSNRDYNCIVNNEYKSISSDFHTHPVSMANRKLTVDEKRLLVISRLKAAKLFAEMGINPWVSISNTAYNNCSEPCISVIITLYNYADYIYECLDSLVNSQLEHLPGNIEVIVVDDASTDNSAALVEKYLENSPLPIYLIKKKLNTGLADGRNLGLKLARSPYIFILDADNFIHPRCLSILHQEITSHDYAAVYGKISRFDNLTREEINYLSCHEWDVSRLVHHPYIDAMAMFNREKILAVGGYSTELIEYGWFGWDDYDLWLKFAQANYDCKFIPQVLSYYRVHSESMINTTNIYALNLAKYFYQKFADLVTNHSHSEIIFSFLKSDICSPSKIELLNHQHQLILQELQSAYAQITAMKTSKFWQLRNFWFNFKKFLGVTKDIDIHI